MENKVTVTSQVTVTFYIIMSLRAGGEAISH